MNKIVASVLLSLLASPALAQSVVTFDVVFHTVYQASGNFLPFLYPALPGGTNNNEPVPEVNLTGTVTLSTLDPSSELAGPPSVNSITLNGTFSSEAGQSPSNGWSDFTFDNAVFDFYAPNSYVALDFTSDPQDWPLIAGTAADGLVSDHGPAANFGGVCPFASGCISANGFPALLFEGATVDAAGNPIEVKTVVFDTNAQVPVFPTYADAGNHPLVSGSVSQTNPASGLGFENGLDAIVIDAVLNLANGSLPYGDGVNGYPGKVRIVTFSNTGNTAYVVEGSIIEVPVPLPAAGWLFASALGLIAWFRRRASRRLGLRQVRAPALVAVAAVSALLGGCFDGSTDVPNTNIDNVAPVADAGADQTVTTFTQVTLDGSGTTDADGDVGKPIFSFAWEFQSVPAGSTANLANADSVIAQFTPDIPGDYVVMLTADDGFAGGTDSDTVTITVEEAQTRPPVADAGADQQVSYVPPGVTVNLDGSASSDPDGDPISFSWQIVSFTSQSGFPPAQQVILIGADSATPAFDVVAADQLGSYTLRLTVSDGTFDDSDEVIVTVAKAFPAAGMMMGSGLTGLFAYIFRLRRRRSIPVPGMGSERS